MPVVWCSISAHGFGHAAQVIPILQELGESIDELRVLLRTCVPSQIFQEQLQVNWDLQAVPQDVGCIQLGPLDIDVAETWEAYQQFHTNWQQRVDQEARAIQAAQADLVISNISYLAIAAAAQANCPGVAIASLSWDRVLEPFMQTSLSSHFSIYETIQKEYAKATKLIRLYPGIEMPAFPSCVDVGPSVPFTKSPSHDLRKFLGVEDGEILVLIAFGGVPLSKLPHEQMDACVGFQFLVGGIPLSGQYTRLHRLEDITMSFIDILRQADVVMTKPGYVTIMTAVHYGIPLVYVRRYNFVDEQNLVDYAHRYGQALELTRADFELGKWEPTLHRVLSIPEPRESLPSPGNHTVVDLLRKYLKG